MHDPAKVLQKDPPANLMVRGTPHRLHTPRQTLQFVEHMTGSPRYLPQTAHFISDHAIGQIFSEQVSRTELLDRLQSLRNLWNRFDVFVIEICTFREFTAQLGRLPRRTLVLNTFSKRDQELHRAAIEDEAARGLSVPPVEITMTNLTQSEVLQDMRRIKHALRGRPVIWVSHMRPPSDDPRYDVVHRTRQHVADTLEKGAAQLGDTFFDPSVIAAEMGQSAFFMKDGEDLDHLTPAAAARLAGLYQSMATEALSARRASA